MLPMTTANLLTPDDLQRFLDRHVPQARLIADVGHTPTVPAAAAVLGVHPDQIVKTLLFVLEPNAQRGPDAPVVPPAVIVIGNGERRIDKKTLGRHFALNAKRVKLADAATVVDLLGYPPGGVPPFGHRQRMPVLVDQAVVDLAELDDGRIFGGGGDDRSMLELNVADLHPHPRADHSPPQQHRRPARIKKATAVRRFSSSFEFYCRARRYLATRTGR
jgi:prolyl-tRNA editing enzyme YbaK/EbsC (Cys-tRNA(Pro) deacylase)